MKRGAVCKPACPVGPTTERAEDDDEEEGVEGTLTVKGRGGRVVVRRAWPVPSPARGDAADADEDEELPEGTLTVKGEGSGRRVGGGGM